MKSVLKNICIMITLIILNPLDARPMGGTRPPQLIPAPIPAPQPIVPPVPQQPAPVPAQVPAPQAVLHTFNDYITDIRNNWKQSDVINAQGVFTNKFIQFINSADLPTTFINILLEAGRNLYLPLSNNTLTDRNTILASNKKILMARVNHPNSVYDVNRKLFKQNFLDAKIEALQHQNPNNLALDTWRDSMLNDLSTYWQIMGEINTASLIPLARKQINITLERYGLIKPVPAQPMPQPVPVDPVQPAIPIPVQTPAPQPVPLPAQPQKKATPISLKIGNTQITIVQGFVQHQKVDAIVNAANEDLQHGGGVAGGISQAAGSQLQQFCDAMPNYPGYTKKCPEGKAVITPSFNLINRGIKHIIHTTGPHGSNPNREQLLTQAYTSSLQLASDNNIRSIAFPAISTNIFKYPIDQATPVAFAAVRDFIKAHPNDFDEIRFGVPGDSEFATYKKWIGELQK